MADMHEIVDASAFGHVLFVAGAVGPVLGACIGGSIGWRTGTSRSRSLRGLFVGLVCPLIWVLWKMFDGITDRLGLDTVRNFFVNIGLFSLIGISIGIGLRWWERRAIGPQ